MLSRLTGLERRVGRAGSLPDRLGPAGASVTDWNDAKEPGFYWGYTGALNSPNASWHAGIVQHFGSGGNIQVLQTVWRIANDTTVLDIVHQRAYNDADGSWGAWVQLHTNIPLANVAITELGTGIDLNTLTTRGLYQQSQDAEASGGSNYPTTYAGFLEVYDSLSSNVPNTNFSYQRYTSRRGEVYGRSRYLTNWSAWELMTIPPRLTGNGELSTNLNTAVDNGFYRFNTGTSNTPVNTAAGSVLVFRAGTSAGQIRQEARRIFTDGTTRDLRVWTRDSQDGGATWNAWVLIRETFSDRTRDFTLTSVAGITLGNATITAEYNVAAGQCHVRVSISLGSTSAITGDIQLSLPLPMENTARWSFSGGGRLSVGGGSGSIHQAALLVANNRVYVRCNRVSGAAVTQNSCGPTIPAAWVTGDGIEITFDYPVGVTA